MKYYYITKRIKNYFQIFYSHTKFEISRMKTLDIDLKNYLRIKPYKFCKDSYKIRGFLEKNDLEKNHFHSVINDIVDPENLALMGRSQSYEFVRSFADILLFAEKYYLYQNDDSKEMWAIQHDENLISVFFEFNDTTVECKFQKSAINMNKKFTDIDQSANDLMDKMLGIDRYEEFIEIEISRHFGNNFVSNFKSLLGSDEFNLETDEVWLMDLIDSKMREIMVKTLYEILEHILRNCLKIENLTVEDFENGVELWRSR